jgi:hypothetical protein
MAESMPWIKVMPQTHRATSRVMDALSSEIEWIF